MTANINLPRILRVGGGASTLLAQTLTELQLAKPLIVTDPFMAQSGNLGKITAQLDDAGVSYGTFTDCVPDPTTDAVDAAMAVLRAGHHDCVIGFGGGSSMDTAKAVAAMALLDGPMRNYKVPASIDSGLPVIAIPTTAGTGAEVTRVAVITDTETTEKMLCGGLGFMPVAALVDYELTLSMPRRLTADTGLDTLCHALEAYVSRKANPFTDSIALTAMRAVYQNIRIACNEPDNHPAREAMMLAATQGGIAFANASVTLIHGMSRPIGAHFHVPHGMSNAMLLPDITAWSVNAALPRYAEAARIMGIAEIGTPDREAVAQLLSALRDLCAELEVPTPEQFGITKTAWFDAIPVMVEQALASGSPANNPAIPEAADIAELYETVWR